MGRMKSEPIYSGVPGCEIPVQKAGAGEAPCGETATSIWANERDPVGWAGKRVCHFHSALGVAALNGIGGVQRKTREWLASKGVGGDAMSSREHAVALRSYRDAILRGKGVVKHPMEWAENILRRAEDDRSIPVIAVQLAEQALRVPPAGED